MNYLVCALSLVLLLSSNVLASNKKTYYFTDKMTFSLTIRMSDGYDLKDLSDARIEIINAIGANFIPIEGPVTRLSTLSPTSDNFYEKHIPEALRMLENERESTRIYLQNCANYASRAGRDPQKFCHIDGIKSLGEEGVQFSYEKLDEINESLLSTPEAFISLSELKVNDDSRFVKIEIKLAKYSLPLQNIALYHNNKQIESLDVAFWEMAVYKGSSGTDYLIQWGIGACGRVLTVHKVTSQGLELITTFTVSGEAC